MKLYGDLCCSLLCLVAVLSRGSSATGTGRTPHDFGEHDAEHIKEHYKGVADIDESKMSEDELEFHFFKQVDSNSDLKLDGLELLQTVAHAHTSSHDKEPNPEEEMEKFRQFKQLFDVHVQTIDQALTDWDMDNDGFIDYLEFVAARRAKKAEKEDS